MWERDAADERDTGPALFVRGNVLDPGYLRPMPEGLVCALGKTVIIFAPKKLLCAIQAARCKQLLCADQSERILLVRADRVLPTFASRQRQIRHVSALAERKRREQLRVFVIGMRADHEHALGRTHRAEREPERCRALVFGCAHLCVRVRVRARDERER